MDNNSNKTALTQTALVLRATGGIGGEVARQLRDAHGVDHPWSYLLDGARTMVELVQRREKLGPFAAYPMQGHWYADGAQPAVRAFPWWMIALASPFVATPRELLEMRYLWNVPQGRDNSKLVATLGQEPHTQLDAAMEAALESMGTLAVENAVPMKPGALRLASTKN